MNYVDGITVFNCNLFIFQKFLEIENQFRKIKPILLSVLTNCSDLLAAEIPA